MDALERGQQQDGKGFVAYGRKSLTGDLELIPAIHWEAGTMDWDRLHLSVIGGPPWFGIKFLDLQDLSPAELKKFFAAASAEEASEVMNPLTSGLTRPPKNRNIARSP